MGKDDSVKKYIPQEEYSTQDNQVIKKDDPFLSILSIVSGVTLSFGSVYISNFLSIPPEWPQISGIVLVALGLVDMFSRAKRI